MEIKTYGAMAVGIGLLAGGPVQAGLLGNTHWNNGGGDNAFGNAANWGTAVPTTNSTDIYEVYIEMDGADKAVIDDGVTYYGWDIRIGNSAGSGELDIIDGALRGVQTSAGYLGNGSGVTGTVNIGQRLIPDECGL